MKGHLGTVSEHQRVWISNTVNLRLDTATKSSQKLSKPVVLMTDTFYREALDEQQKARGSYFEKRSRLEQLVGNEVFKEFESMVDTRESST